MFEKLSKFREEKVHKFLWSLTEKYPNRTRIISVDGKPYLRRFYITPRRRNEAGVETGDHRGYGIYLHYFYMGDEDRELHNHPWKTAMSYILCGGYLEERKNNLTNEVETRDVSAGQLNLIRNTDFHRVILKPGVKHTWTIFFSGERVQDWGFWDRDTGEYTKHKDFVVDEDQGYKTNAE